MYPITGRGLAEDVNLDPAIAALFANGENGSFLQPDPTTMYTTPFGLTNPVVDADTVAFWFPRIYPDQIGEQLPDPSFNEGTGNWYATSGTLSWDAANKALVTTAPTPASGLDRGTARVELSTVPGRIYTVRAELNIAATSGNGCYVRVLDVSENLIKTLASLDGNVYLRGNGNNYGLIDTFIATTEVTYIEQIPSFVEDGGTVGLSMVSVVPGVCAHQATMPGSRPQLIPGKLRFDGVDDYMVVAGGPTIIQAPNDYTVATRIQFRSAPSNVRAVVQTVEADGSNIAHIARLDTGNFRYRNSTSVNNYLGDQPLAVGAQDELNSMMSCSASLESATGYQNSDNPRGLLYPPTGSSPTNRTISTIGAGWNGSSFQNFSNMDVSSFVLRDAYMTQEELVILEESL